MQTNFKQVRRSRVLNSNIITPPKVPLGFYNLPVCCFSDLSLKNFVEKKKQHQKKEETKENAVCEARKRATLP